MAHRTEDPTDPLSVLDNETRIDILRALAEAERALSFTELREQVGIRDTGKFNYHLQKLGAYFVRETEAGYELGHAGTRLIGLADGNDDPMPADATVEESCPVCGADGCGKLFHIHLTSPWG